MNKEQPKSIDEALSRLDEALLVPPGPTIREVLHDDAQTLRAEVAHRVESVQDRTLDLSRVSAMVVRQQLEVARDKTLYAAAVVDTQVRANLWPVIGGVAVSAFVFGFFLATREGVEA